MMSIGLLFLFLILRILNAQNTCTNNAVCINIRNCPSLIEILRGPRPLSQETLEALRNSQCGFEGNDPMVCCINQNTVSVTTPTEPPTPTTNMVQVMTTNVSDPPDVTNHPNLRILNHQMCGHFTTLKIIMGNRTNVLDYPWMALIAYESRRGPEFRCAGTVISERYILTAGHCITFLPDDVTPIGVRVGDHDLSKELDCDNDNSGLDIICAERYQDFGIKSVHVHPEYTRRKFQNDIALIRLNSSVDFRPTNVKPICLPFGTATTLNHKKATVTGWGLNRLELDLRGQKLLQDILLLMTNEKCAEVYNNTVEIWYKQICAGGLDIINSCIGDSGGPLQAPAIYNAPDVHDKIRMIQYGVVSYSPKLCGTVGLPEVYTRVSHYMDWILNTIRD